VQDAIELACPADASRLRRDGGAFVCGACAARFPVDHGVVRFLPGADAFYEGRYAYTVQFVPAGESLARAWPLWLINAGYLWAVRRHVPAGSTVIEIGCGGGVEYFARRYRVIGLDLSLESLAAVAKRYAACLQADAAQRIPLPDASVDAVISSFAWEHFPPERKPLVLAECARVLRPGGKLVFLYDLACESPLYRSMRRSDANLFDQQFIEGDGHFGWQSPRENRAIFEAGGFRVREHRGKEKLLVEPGVFEKLRHWDGGLRRLAALGLRFRSGARFHAYNAGLRVFDETLGRLLPERWARVAVTVCEKRA
jgi:SAM-dependent methyltransferase